MGFWNKLFRRNKTTTKPSNGAATTAAPTNGHTATNGSTKTNGTVATVKTVEKDQCAAITAAGTQCTMGSRDGSKYCGRHKGYRPPAASVAAQAKDTKPRAKSGNDTVPAGRRSHVTHNGYKLYQKGNRYFFSKKSQAEAKADGATPVYEMPSDRTVTETPNGLPILKKS